MTNPTADLLRRTEAYLSALHGSVARHDNLAANLGCAGCELRNELRTALATAPPAVWVEGDPLMEAIAAAVWERCARDDADMPQQVCDDPRTIAAAAASVVAAERAALKRVREYLEARINTVAVDPAEVFNLIGPIEPPLSPYYSHEACGFHWHGRDGMDIPMREGQPVCPRCELRRLTAATDPTWPRRAWDLGLLHKGGDPHHCPTCLAQPEPPKDFICPGAEANAKVLANPQSGAEEQPS